MPAILDVSSVVGFADMGWAAPGAPPSPQVIVRTNTVGVTLNGHDLTNVLSLRCSFGFDQPVSTAEITLPHRPDDSHYYDHVGITVNGVLRFAGIVMDFDHANWPRTCVVKAKGDLVFAELYLNQEGILDPDQGDPGLALEDFLPGAAATGTLKEIVSAVLDKCGVTYDPTRFADPPHVYGLEAPDAFVWKWGTSGLAYLHGIFEASAGYRLFNSGDGNLYLAQVVGRPRGTVDLTLSQGLDILEGARANRSIEKTRNGVVINGFDDGSGGGPLQVVLVPGNDVQPASLPFVEVISSSLIEDEVFANDLAVNYWLPEVNREITMASVPTWRDDVMGPAQTVMLDALDRLSTGEPGWTLSVTLEVDEHGALTQTPNLILGGLPDDYVALPV